jgi:predicted transcriptional regulator YdeE
MDDPIDEPFDFIGFMTDMDLAKQEMTYVIGCLVHPNTPDQPDYTRYELEASDVITTIIVGTEDKVYPRAHRLTEEAATKKGLKLKGPWAMEIYTQRFMDSKERNNGVIEMDYRIPVTR